MFGRYGILSSAMLSCCLIMGCSSERRPLQVYPSQMAVMPDSRSAASSASRMTREDVVRCARLMSSAEQAQSRFKVEQEQIEVARVGLTESGRALDQARKRLGKPDDRQVQAFGQHVGSYQRSIAAFNAKVSAHNADVIAAKAQYDDYNASCVGRPYDRAMIDGLPESVRRVIADHSHGDNESGGGALVGQRVIYIRKFHPVGISGFQ